MKTIKILNKRARIVTKSMKYFLSLAMIVIINNYNLYASNLGKMPPKSSADKNTLIVFLDKLYGEYIVPFAGVAALVSIGVALLFGIFNSGSATKRAETKEKVLYALICFGVLMILPWIIKEVYKNL